MSTPTISEKLKTLALDLTKTFPRSPRETLAGYVVAARILDKCRAVLNDTAEEYLYNCPLDRYFFDFTGIDADAFKALVATGASDEEVAEWIQKHSQVQERLAIVKWNNEVRYKKINELSDETQLFFEEEVLPKLPKHHPVYVFLDVLDLEEGRL